MSTKSKIGHGLPKVLPGPAMPNPSTPCGQATPETAKFYSMPIEMAKMEAVFSACQMFCKTRSQIVYPVPVPVPVPVLRY
jgi:hypothetical protein